MLRDGRLDSSSQARGLKERVTRQKAEQEVLLSHLLGLKVGGRGATWQAVYDLVLAFVLWLVPNRVRLTLQNEMDWEAETLLFEGVNGNEFNWKVRIILR